MTLFPHLGIVVSSINLGRSVHPIHPTVEAQNFLLLSPAKCSCKPKPQESQWILLFSYKLFSVNLLVIHTKH